MHQFNKNIYTENPCADSDLFFILKAVYDIGKLARWPKCCLEDMQYNKGYEGKEWV